MQWFKHDSNANTDEKLQSILLDYGLEGYGLYWYCLELIVNRLDKDNINFELKHDARLIARNTGCSIQKVSEMMKTFCDLGLFENNEGRISCLKLIKRLDTSMTSNIYMRDLIKKSKEHHDAIMTQSENVMQEESRLDEKRLKNTHQNQSRKNALDDGFLEFWNKYPKKTGKDAANKSWVKLKPNIDEVLKALSWQIESDQWQKQSGQFIPNPSTYLNQGRWKDEPTQESVF
ncbi:MAG: DUF4373 domain-containing protein [Paludibacter sp.]|nr:DUF4373 domain-containing protein [Paludibacter sp.]